MTYLIASSRNWRPHMAANVARVTGQTCTAISTREELSAEYLSELRPTAIFFPHWSHLVPAEVYDNFECVIFHMTDLPYGRGGSPLQNLLARSIYETQISALRCVRELDAGPVYMKKPLSLHGTAHEIYVRANEIIEAMIIAIIREHPEPVEQSGEVVTFKRRTPQDGDLLELRSLQQVYDYIRMLDADGYPKAFIETEYLRLEFSRASLRSGQIVADVVMKAKVPNE